MTEEQMSEVRGQGSGEAKELSTLPTGWVTARLEDISLINPKYNSDLNDGLEVSFVPMSAVEEESGRIDLTRTNRVMEVKRGYTPFIDGDIVFAKITPCMENGKVAVVSGSKNGVGFGSTEFHVARPMDQISGRYIFFFLVQRSYRRDAKHNMSGSAGQLRVSKSFFSDSVLPLPPFAEQRRIVAKIEELFSSLDKGVENLKTAQQQLKVYRQAVLKWAFEGKLTNKSVDDGELPKEWRVVKLKTVANAIDPQPSHRTPPIVRDGIPYVSIKDFDSASGKIDFINTRRVSLEVLKEHLERYQLQIGDFVIGKIGTIGKPVRVALPQNYSLSANIVLIQPLRINAAYLFYFFQSSAIEKEFSFGTKATTQAAFGIQKVRELNIYLPQEREQRAIVAEIESRLSVCDRIEETIKESLKQAEALRQSILKKAFEGKLVPQDPNDEPASALLTRIKAEGASAHNPSPARGKGGVRVKRVSRKTAKTQRDDQ